MYEICYATYCGNAYHLLSFPKDCDCIYKELNCCHRMPQCHITLFLKPVNIEDGNNFTFNYRIEDADTTICTSMCRISVKTSGIHARSDSIEETIPLLYLKNEKKLSIINPGPIFAKQNVNYLIDSYKNSKLARSEYFEHKDNLCRQSYIGAYDDDNNADNDDNDSVNNDHYYNNFPFSLIQRFDKYELNETYPPCDWILNDEYTADEKLIEHPFFGNISEIVRLYQDAVEELLTLTNYAITETAYTFK